MDSKEAKRVLEEMRKDEIERGMMFKTAAFKFIPERNAAALKIAIDLIEKETGGNNGEL